MLAARMAPCIGLTDNHMATFTPIMHSACHNPIKVSINSLVSLPTRFARLVMATRVFDPSMVVTISMAMVADHSFRQGSLFKQGPCSTLQPIRTMLINHSISPNSLRIGCKFH